MPDAEVQILISAVDNMSATLKRIEGTLGETQKTVEKQTEATTKSFDKQMGSLLVLGNAANQVDNIFSSYQNLQLRLENASERVANAQDRLTNAQRNLEKITKKAGATAEEYADAQRQVEMASRSLQISQNNQARMNNMVIGTYISMGVQAISLTASFGAMKIAVRGLALEVQALWVKIGPLGWAIAGVSVAISGVIWYMNKSKEETDNLTTSYESLEGAINDVKTAQEELYESQYTEQIGTEDKRINMLKLAQLSDEGEQRKLINQYLEETGQTTNFNLNSEIGRRNFLILQLEDEEKKRERMRLSDEIAKQTAHEQWLTRFQDITVEVKMTKELAQLLNEMATHVGNIGSNWDSALESYDKYYQATTKSPSAVVSAIGSPKKQTMTNYEQYYKPAGTNISITGDIYGTNPQQIAKALADELRKKVVI